MSQQKDPELLEIPGTEGAGEDGINIAVQQMIDLMGQTITPQNIPQLNVGAAQQIPGLQVGAAQNIPLQQIAGMTGIEQTVQGMLGKYLGTSATEGQAYKLGMGEISKTLGGEAYDPRTSDFWKGYREYSAMEQEKGVSDIRRRGQLGGGLFGTPNQRAEAEYVRGMGAQRTMQLGGLYEKERERKTGAVAQALGYAGFGEQGALSRLEAGSKIGALPRTIQDRRSEAAFAQKSGQSQADFNRQQLQSQATYTQALGQSGSDFAQQQAQNQALFAQLSGQGQADYASQLTEIGIQTGAAQELMPQWNIDEGGSELGGILGLIGTLASIGK